MPGQLALFEVPLPADVTHDWAVRLLGPNECAACSELWFSGADRDATVRFLTEVCPAKAADAEVVQPAYIYL